MASLLPWGDDAQTSYAVAHTWTVLDDFRVAELEFEESRKRVFDNRLCPYVSVNNALMEDHRTKSRHYGQLTQMVKQMDCLTIYNDKQLWSAFKFLDKNRHQARIEVASELERTHAKRLRAISVEHFKKDLPYIPTPERFYDTYLTLNVADIMW